MKRLYAFVVLLCVSLSASAAVRVVATFSVLADLTRQVGGERVSVVSLVGPNQDAHVFQPSPADVRAVSQAQVFVSNGLGMEGWLGRLVRSASFRGVSVVAASGVHTIAGSEGEAVDPHAWHDPQRVQIYLRNIRDGLIKADPSGREVYTARAAEVSRRVAALDQWAAAQFSAVPAARRKVVTSHDAFGYLGDRYRIRFLAPQGVSTDAEASARGVAALIRQIRQEKVHAVFFENMSNQQLLRQIAAEAKVNVNSKLYSDALSEAGGPADTWERMFRYNVSTIMKFMQ